MSYSLRLDKDRCISCKACEVHCQVWQRVPVGMRLGAHLHDGPFVHEGRVSLRVRYTACRSCDNAPCLEVCPSGAMRRREDGIVYIDEALCVGCESCGRACPWHVPQYDAAAGKMRKCDLCRDRLDAGLLPACVTGCVTNALELENS